ncbi:hypothetical protein A2567_02855 [Candidatus Azambacteria bacterium RIFOXYD1_FULL_42_11]|uniref:Uncharacterized protein n=1 Tax=Candidatus Azambacteria bacterium RIFOXYD1_FULL_42_11 TaxID=1797310 RepID=A0A1F5CH74_9BACT|nr:MAG: hypothetical protein A2567_02855 [Candidatus Azambacteria bacterium RIFOXYD1_FULL_42_11]
MSDYVIVTHGGKKFHADEVCAIAAVELAFKALNLTEKRSIKVIRISNKNEVALRQAYMRIDIGNRYDPPSCDFDHHQEGGAGCRDNGVPYASFGLVWKHLGVIICDGNKNVARIVENSLVQQVDAEDSGFPLYDKRINLEVVPFTISSLFSCLVPTLEENQDSDGAFAKAVELAKMIITRKIAHARAAEKYREKITAAICEAEKNDPRIIILDSDCNWQFLVMCRTSVALFVVYPVTDQWMIKAVPKGGKIFSEVRKLFPTQWAVGNNPQKLALLTGVADALFCHIKRFAASARSKEGAISLAQLAADAE